MYLYRKPHDDFCDCIQMFFNLFTYSFKFEGGRALCTATFPSTETFPFLPLPSTTSIYCTQYGLILQVNVYNVHGA